MPLLVPDSTSDHLLCEKICNLNVTEKQTHYLVLYQSIINDCCAVWILLMTVGTDLISDIHLQCPPLITPCISHVSLFYLPSAMYYALWISHKRVVWVSLHLDLLMCLHITSIQLALAMIETCCQKTEWFMVPFRYGEGFAKEFSLDKWPLVFREEKSLKIQNSKQREQNDERMRVGMHSWKKKKVAEERSIKGKQNIKPLGLIKPVSVWERSKGVSCI